ncbi:hypothetical protein V8J36_15545 [Frigidibacter sp. MR17.14]|uniref:hypothetical protein n=1 Tax=Frigidibacter sp. MR17.14 TaxID=3126509 RepID=UPI00301313AD
MSSVERPPSGIAGQAFRLFLLGPLRLADAEDRDLTPGSGVQRAMLAVLALAPRGSVSRVRLQDMFWGEKDPQLAAQSLRTALHGLRRSLAALPVPIVTTDETTVGLRLDLVAVDLLALQEAAPLPAAALGGAPEVLEGLNPRLGGGAEGFEDWLRDQRSFWSDRIETLVAAAGATLAVGPAPAPATLAPARAAAPPERAPALPPVLGLLVPLVEGGGPRAQFLADGVLDRISVSLRDHLGVRLYDYRELGGDTDMAGIVDEPLLYLRLRFYHEPGWSSIRMIGLGPGLRDMLWSAECELGALDGAPIEERAADFLAEVVTLSAETVHRPPQSENEATISPFHAMNVMFQLDRGALDELRGQIATSWERTADPVYLSLQAYLNTFRVGEHWGAQDGDLREETLEMLCSGLLERSQNGLAAALAGHAAGYVLHDRDRAEALLARAVTLVPQSAFAWDHFALHRTYCGRYDSAREASARAMRLGAGSPIRFSFETTNCMISTLEGRFEAGRDLGRAVLAKRPRYGAALRYTAVSLAHNGQIAEAERLIARIRAMDPTFSSGWVAQNRMAIENPGARALLQLGLTRAGA